jgi:hypothetical protein
MKMSTDWRSCMNDIDPTQTIELVGPPVVANELGLARSSAIRLMQAGLAGPLYSDGQREMVARQQVDDLARWSTVSLAKLPPAFIVRVGPRQRNEDEHDNRLWYGWHSLESDRATQRDGIDRWWEIRNPDELRGQLLVVTVSGFAVYVARIDPRAAPTHHPVSATWWLHLQEATARDADADAWRGIRVKTPGGGAVLRHRLD